MKPDKMIFPIVAFSLMIAMPVVSAEKRNAASVVFGDELDLEPAPTKVPVKAAVKAPVKVASKPVATLAPGMTRAKVAAAKTIAKMGMDSSLEGSNTLRFSVMNPKTKAKEIISLGYEAVWESPGVMLVTLSDDKTNFDLGKSNLNTDVHARMETLSNLLTHLPKHSLKLDGHTDNRGPRWLNMSLSMSRAENVKKALIGLGVAKDSFEKVEGWGFDKPLVSNDTAEGRSRNRRVELRIKIKHLTVESGMELDTMPASK